MATQFWGRTIGRLLSRSIPSHAYGDHASGRRGLLSSNRTIGCSVGRLAQLFAPLERQVLPLGRDGQPYTLDTPERCSGLSRASLPDLSRRSERRRRDAAEHVGILQPNSSLFCPKLCCQIPSPSRPSPVSWVCLRGANGVVPAVLREHSPLSPFREFRAFRGKIPSPPHEF